MLKRIVIVLVGIAVVVGTIELFASDTLLNAGQWYLRYRAGLTTHRVTAAGHEIVYAEGGTGEPLILLHGFGADRNAWAQIAPYLTAHFHVIAPDLPGFGESTRDPNARYGFADQASRVDAFATTLGITGPFHIGGNSMGGGIAGLYAAQHPERVKTLWLLDTAGVPSAKPSKLREMIAAGHNPMLVSTVEDFDGLLAFAFVHPPRVPAILKPAIVRRMATQRPFNEKVFVDMAAATFSLEGVLKGSQIPTLITWGDHDQLTDVSGAGILLGLMPKATLDVLPDVGHVPMNEQPKLVAEHYLTFQAAQKK